MATARLGGLSRELTLSVQGLTGPEAQRSLARFARAERDKVVAAKVERTGLAPKYITAVNGRVGLSEDAVTLPGPIVYTFDTGSEIATYLLDFLKERSPKLTGDYIRGFRFIQAGRYVDALALRPSAPFYIVNIRPFSRKIEVGAMKMSVPPHIFEDASQAARRRYGNVAKFRVQYLDLVDGYVLKGRGKRRRGKSRAGERMRYPAVLVEPL